MKKINLTFIFLLLCTIIATAQSDDSYSDLVQKLLDASMIQNDSDRLKAFDGIVHLVTEGNETIVTSGKWYYTKNVDALTDQEVYFFTLIADEGESVYGDPITLVIRSTNTRVQVYIVWDSYLGSDVIVTHRFGKDTPKVGKWNISTDSKGSFYPGDTIQFVKDMLATDTFIARVTPYNENPIISVFDVKGLKDILLSNDKHHDW